MGCESPWAGESEKRKMQRVKKGDTVEVISGDEKGKRGEVHEVLLKKHRVIIGGVNLIKKAQRRTGNVRTQVGIIEREGPLELSNVMPVCKSCNKATRVRFQGTGLEKTRICARCGAALD